ncbi:MAG: aspartate aminotransferase family protein, partial [Proteobacteria bacterium]|nr:aspartate aminotransferase family protein [Pseudomonadota bacterium]
QVYQAGTLSGSPVAVAAGMASLRLTRETGFYDTLAAATARLVGGLSAAGREAGVRFSADSIGGMFGVYFSDAIPASFADVMASDRERFNRFFHAMLEAGHYFAPSAFEAGFVSAAHGEAEIDATISAATEIFATLR